MRVLITILKFIWGIFAVIGITVVAIAAYLWFVDPFQLKPILFPSMSPASVPTVSDNAPRSPARATSPTTVPQLNAQQAAAANSLGIDPNAVANLITPTTETCAVAALGQTRVDQIKAGATPSAVDLIQAGHCLGQ